MELFKKAEKNYKEKNFQVAYECYLRCLEDEKTDKKTMIDCCQKIVHLGEQFNIQWDGVVQELLARSFFGLGQYGSAIRHAGAAMAKKKSREVYEILWESHWREGNLLRAEDVAREYLSYCRSKHLCDSGLSFAGKLKKVGLFQEHLSAVVLELEILRGNVRVVAGKLKELECSHDEMGRYWDCINLCKGHWERERIVREVFLNHWRKSLVGGEVSAIDIIERQRIIYFVLIDFLLEGDAFDKVLRAYALAFERKGLLISLDDHKDEKCSLQSNTRNVQDGVEWDLIRNIRDKGMDDVLGKTCSYDFFSEELQENKTGVYFDGLDDDFLVENAENLLVGLMEMNLCESALRLIDKIRGRVRRESMGYQINMAYMEVVLLARAGRHHQAMDLIHDSLRTFPVKPEEKDAFLKERDRLIKTINLSKESA